MKNQKKAVSPIVSTVLLVMIVIVLAIIILLWARGFVDEIITKEIAGNEKRVNEYCMDVEISQIINDDGSFGFENKGNVPLYGFRVKTSEGGGSSQMHRVEGDQGRVNPGFSVVIEDLKDYDDYETIIIIPTLLGKTELGDSREFDCPEGSGIELK
jgi:flagellin-like protein